MNKIVTDIMEETKNRVILVTGFGPFQGHPTNASWEAVKELKKFDIEKEFKVTLVTEEIPVTYEGVSTRIPQLWSDHDPILVVHVGVSAKARCLTLESRAHRTGYVKLDVDKKCPAEKVVEDSIRERVIDAVTETGMDLKNICDNINNCDYSCNEERCNAEISNNAGRYLCEYIFYQSLDIHPKKTIFVHVPDLNIYPAKKTAQGLYHVIKIAFKIIEESEK